MSDLTQRLDACIAHRRNGLTSSEDLATADMFELCKNRIAALEAALTKIAKMKSEPIGDTGFATGPLALLNACQRLAREVLRKPKTR